jgi:hypothetical protein
MKAITKGTHKLFALVKTLTREAFDKLIITNSAYVDWRSYVEHESSQLSSLQQDFGFGSVQNKKLNRNWFARTFLGLLPKTPKLDVVFTGV